MHAHRKHKAEASRPEDVDEFQDERLLALCAAEDFDGPPESVHGSPRSLKKRASNPSSDVPRNNPSALHYQTRATNPHYKGVGVWVLLRLRGLSLRRTRSFEPSFELCGTTRGCSNSG